MLTDANPFLSLASRRPGQYQVEERMLAETFFPPWSSYNDSIDPSIRIETFLFVNIMIALKCIFLNFNFC